MEALHQSADLGFSFQDADVAGDLADSKSTSGGKLFICGSYTRVPISCSCMKQTAVSHSRNYLIRRRSQIRRNSCAQFVGPCAQHQTQEDEITYGGQESNIQHWFCSSKRTHLQLTGIFVCLRRSRCCDQDDHKRPEPVNETYLPNPPCEPGLFV